MGFADLFSDLSAFSNPYGAPSKGEWKLDKGIFTNYNGEQVVFFAEKLESDSKQMKTALEQTTDVGSRRLVFYKYPYIDGQVVDDLGREGETYVFNIKFFGENYQNLYRKFIDVCNVPGTGTLLHPTYSAIRGSIPVRYHNHEIIHRYDEFNCVTIKVTFVEDFRGTLTTTAEIPATPDSKLRSALQTLTNVQSVISTKIYQVGALLNLPNTLMASFKSRLNSLTGQISSLIGQLTATFSSSATAKSIAAQAANVGGVANLTSGTIQTGTDTTAELPAIYQVGLSNEAQTLLTEQASNFINANQITAQKAVYLANQNRASISSEISQIEETYGNDGYDMVDAYRSLAVSLQEVVQICLSSSQDKIKVYVTQTPMSLRMIAKANNLGYDRQNEIEALNPSLCSINYIPKGTSVIVPAS